jgi:3-methylfumaryl-CoA hydratase
MIAATPSIPDATGLVPEAVDEAIGPLQGRMLAATLGHAIPPLEPGAAIPSLAHWLHCLPVVAHDQLDENGHPTRGEHLPNLPYKKRMFAGADTRFLEPIRVGEPVRRTARVTDIAAKEGRSGSFYLVNVRQEFSGPRGLLLVEDQKIVYRDAVRPLQAAGRAVASVETDSVWKRSYLPDERMLFRYSALLFSAHRIHFDRDFTLTEGYPALVVHGQLVATCLLRLAEENAGRSVESFSYRSVKPMFEKRPFFACGRPHGQGAELWATDDQGAICVRASAVFRDS